MDVGMNFKRLELRIGDREVKGPKLELVGR